VIVWRTVDIRDPATGDSLGSVRRRRLELDVTAVEDLFCIARVHIPAPNIFGNLFGQQTTWIAGGDPEDQEKIVLKEGDDVVIYATEKRRRVNSRELTSEWVEFSPCSADNRLTPVCNRSRSAASA
jgi:hypothetical protein